MPSNAKPRLKTPQGACDTHIHIYDARFPTAPGGPLPPPDALVPAYRRMQERLGLERVVIVQPNAYGDDNRCTLEGMAAFGAAARGVAVVKPGVSDAELQRLTTAGVRGVRFMMLPGGPVRWEWLDEMAARVHDFGWHVQLQFDGRDFPKYEAQIRRLPGVFVIDHNGKFLEPVAVEHAAFKSLLKLIDTGRGWVKLSAPYETSKSGPPAYEDVGVLARALVRAAPERMVWASNWPHPSAKREAMPDDADLLDLLLDWAPDEATRNRILLDNPARLYGF
ncbi:MAG TPA: amidohydrolase family protein [Alphaproteobacteria bacterium]|nr:amidohydrolase family protein [Alphaproteobacteria bacterium]